MNRRKFNFSGLDLNDGSTFRITETSIFGMADIEIVTADLARADGLVQLYDRLAGRLIDFSGQIRTTSQNDTDIAIDALKRRLRYGSSGIMTVDFPEGDRLFYGKVININISRSSTDISRATFSFQLQTPSPVSSSSVGMLDFCEVQNITASAITASTRNVGTYLAKPIVTINIGVNTQNQFAEFRIGNPETSQYVSFSAVVDSNDSIRIDCEAQKIFLNTQEIKPSGAFPSWLSDGGFIEYNDSMSSRSVILTAQYNPKYL